MLVSRHSGSHICAVKVRSQHNRKQVVISVKTLHLFSDEQNRLSSSRTFGIIIIFWENPSIMGHSFTLIWLERKTSSNISKLEPTVSWERVSSALVTLRPELGDARISYLARTKLVHNLRFMQIKLNRFANMFIMLKTLLNPQLNLNIIVSISRPPKDHLNGCKNKNVDNCRYLGTA